MHTELQAMAPEVEADLQRYNAAFVQANSNDDPSLMLPWLRVPVMRYAAGSVLAMTTPAEVEAMYRSMVDRLKGTGYSRSVLSDFDVDVLNATTAVVKCHAVREQTGGGVVEEFEAGYVMVRGDEHWQVASLISRRP